MSVVRVNIVVEGDTEEAFVRHILTPYLSARQVFPIARKVTTNRKRSIRGGLVTYAHARRDIVTWLKEDQKAFVSTLFDLYALPRDFPGFAALPASADSLQRAQHLEAALAADIKRDIDDPGRLIPYFQRHEFEALLFSDPALLDAVVSTLSPPSQLKALTSIRAAFATPEDINDHPETAPSKRLKTLYPGYDKVLFGELVAERIGLPAIRAACPHFNDWLTRLEQLQPP